MELLPGPIFWKGADSSPPEGGLLGEQASLSRFQVGKVLYYAHQCLPSLKENAV